MLELAFRDTVSVEYDPRRFGILLILGPLSVEHILPQHFDRHLVKIVDHLLSGSLDSTIGNILGRVRINVANQRSEGGTSIGTRRRMDHIRADSRVSTCTLPVKRAQHDLPHHDRRVVGIRQHGYRPWIRNYIDAP